MEDAAAEPSPRSAMTRGLISRAVAKGEISLPAVPHMLDEYVAMCDTLFTALGTPLDPEQREHLRAAMGGQLTLAYDESPRSNILITYDSPVGESLEYFIVAQWSTVEQAYENWIATREPPLFGTEPDARVMALVSEAGEPAVYRVLDIGAGTGRNSLALARRGHPVDAIEMTPKFAEIIDHEAAAAGLDVRVLQRDVFDAPDELRSDYRLILLSEVVSDFRDTDQLRRLFELAARSLAPGGDLLFNIFLPRDGYTPDEAARQYGQHCYTTIFTRGELAEASSGLPLHLVSDHSVYDYEKTHLPADSWPPTSWYAQWVNGQDVFDGPLEDSPIEMRWLVYRKVV